MTAPSVTSVDDYLAGVRDALSDLAPDVRDDLLEDLREHLTDAAADGSSLTVALGTPQAYAAELRAAAGLAEPDTSARPRRFAGARAANARLEAWWTRTDPKLGRLVGYDRLSDLLRALRPAWWVLRGWVLLNFLTDVYAGGVGIIPPAGPTLFGLLLLVACVTLSVWYGRRCVAAARDREGATDSSWSGERWRVAAFVVNALLVVPLLVLATNLTDARFATAQTVSGDSSPLDNVSDLVVYDQNGNPVPHARLYDQGGNPIQVGSPAQCTQNADDGTYVSAENPYLRFDEYGQPQTYVYPLCPAQMLRLANGPGALPSPAPSPAVGPAVATPSPVATPAPSGPPATTPSTAPLGPTPSPTGAVARPSPTASR